MSLNLTRINLTGYFEQTQFPDTDMPVEFRQRFSNTSFQERKENFEKSLGK